MSVANVWVPKRIFPDERHSARRCYIKACQTLRRHDHGRYLYKIDFHWLSPLYLHTALVQATNVPTCLKPKPCKESIDYFLPLTSGGHNCCMTAPPRNDKQRWKCPVSNHCRSHSLYSIAWDKQRLDNTPRVRFYIVDAANLIIRSAIVTFTDDSNIAIVTAVRGRNPRPPDIMQLPFT